MECFQSTNPTCIDLILTNQEDLFSNCNTCEVGISDHHHLVSRMLKKKISKGSDKTLFYRDYKKFEENKFAEGLAHEFQIMKNPFYSQFEKAFVTVLGNHVSLKKKHLRFNHSPFMTKTLRKTIMARSRLKNIYNKKLSYDNWDIYKKQRNFCVELLCKTKQDYFNNIDIKNVNDRKNFWKMIKPYFSNKGLNSNKTFLSEKGSPIKDPVVIAATMNDYFVNITQTIGLKQFQSDHANNLSEDHTSIISIKPNLDNVSDKFDLKKVHEKEVKREINQRKYH